MSCLIRRESARALKDIAFTPGDGPDYPLFSRQHTVHSGDTHMNASRFSRQTMSAMFVAAIASVAITGSALAQSPAASEPAAGNGVVRAVPAATPAPAPAAVPADEVGTTTRALLAAQADGRRAGNTLLIPGSVATASWNRYLESFTHPIPEFYKERVEDGGNKQ